MTRSRMARIRREISSEISETTAKGTPSASIAASIGTNRAQLRLATARARPGRRIPMRPNCLAPGLHMPQTLAWHASRRSRGPAGPAPWLATADAASRSLRWRLLGTGLGLLGADAFDPLAQAGQ